LLTPAGDGDALARAILFLFDHPDVQRELGENAIRDVDLRFRVSLQADRFLAWYHEILAA
jgi:glycosyltransferase involved in cell wall biosynthesis